VPTYSKEELTAVVEAAQALDRRVAAHSLTGEATARAIAAGVLQLEHAGFTADESGTQDYDPEVASQIAEAGISVTPTLSPRYHTVAAMRERHHLTTDEAHQLSRWQRMLDAQIDQVGKLLKSGVRVVAGSDAGWRSTPFGALVDELELMCRAGLSPNEAIVAATARAAEVVGLADRIGALRPGYVADLIATEGDPLQDIGALRRLGLVMREGRVVASFPELGRGTARSGGARDRS
jgi:imidazolonepropionase-like amidohydrolase